MLASFHSKGAIPSCSDMLNTCASAELMCSTVCFLSILGDIPSTPGDVFAFMLLILLATTYGGTTNCHNLSPSGPLKFVSGTGNELVSSLVHTELKCTFNLSAITNTCVIIIIPNSVPQWHSGKKSKGSFNIAQYPVSWTAQSALHVLPSLADLFIPTPRRLLREAF